MKKIDEALVASLSRTNLQALLNAPDELITSGIRDPAILHLAFAGGLLVSQLVSLTLEQFDGRPPDSIGMIGKRRRERVIPVWQETAAAIRAWIAVKPDDGDTALFLNNPGRMMTRSCVEYILEKQAVAAVSVAATLATKSISRHVLRHSCAMHMLQSAHRRAKFSCSLASSKNGLKESFIFGGLRV
ncbi:tyrosine-type recombinase/integrase [Brucella sp. 21LCYQ03]|nr:tyrosine-type recombinase/integrase [Brucella sp. 21LCYQ03]